MAGIPYYINDSSGSQRFVLNRSFWVAEHDIGFNWGMVDTPRGHGSRALDTAYMGQKKVVFTGYVGSGTYGGSLPFGVTAITDVTYLAALQAMLAFLAQYRRCIIDYRNGWIQYALFESAKVTQSEGWPDLRAVNLNFAVEDPFAYALQMVNGTASSNTITATMTGNAPSAHYFLYLRSATTEMPVRVYHVQNATVATFTIPAYPADPLVLHGWQWTVFQSSLGSYGVPTSLTKTAWGRVQPGSVFPILIPGSNTLSFSNPDGSPLTVGPIGNPGATVLQAQLQAHSAVWWDDSLVVPSNVPPGMYDLAQFGVDVYG